MSESNTCFHWQDHLRASILFNQDDPQHRFIQLATVTPQGEPRNRTVVFRGFDEDEESILFCTDRRSQKYDELIQKLSVELCWYFLKSREQYRLRGVAHFVQQEQIIQQVWSALSPTGKAQFFGPRPGEQRTPNLGEADATHHDHLEYSPHFVVIKLSFHLVDYLSLASSQQGFQQRFLCRATQNGWKSYEVYA